MVVMQRLQEISASPPKGCSYEIERMSSAMVQRVAFHSTTSHTIGMVLSELKPYLGKAMTLLLCFFKKDKVERGALAHELSLLHGNDDEETNKENPTGLRHVLLPSLSLYL